MLSQSYLAILGGFSLKTHHSLFTHKASLFGLYLFVTAVNLRSAIIGSDGSALVALTSLQLAIAIIILIPTLFFPLESKAPLHLAAIQSTMRARKQFGEATTAFPTPAAHTPHRPASLRSSIDEEAGDAETAPLVAAEEKEAERPPPPPETRASLYSRMYFGYVTPAIIKHYKIQFTLPAVPDLPPGDKAAAVVAAFRAESSRVEAGSTPKVNAGSESLAEAAQASDLVPSSESLAWRLTKHFRHLLALQFIWATFDAILTLTPAVGLRWILAYINERDEAKARGAQPLTPVHMAVMYALLMFLGQVAQSIAASQALFIGRRICVRLRAILITEVISKTLRRSDIGGPQEDKKDEASKAVDDKTTPTQQGGRATDGQVVNLVSVDVFKTSEVCAYLHFAFPGTPITIGLCLALLWNLLGWSALVGFGVMLAIAPCQTLVSRVFVRIQRAMLEATDRRLNLTTEVLNCIKTVKFFAWEEAFAARLGEIRAAELAIIRRRCFAWLFGAFFYIGAPVLVTVVTFAAHTRLFHQPLTAETAFTALAIFNLLRNPLEALPDMIVQILSALVSVRRIDAYLREPETMKYEQLLPSEDDEERSDSDPVVGFQDATFVFKTEDKDTEETTSSFALKDLNLSFPEGKLSIIAGPVGSGKTCLLLSLLGETHRVGGRTFMPCPIARALEPIDLDTGLSNTVAYVSQTAWLLGTTVRENILFGSAYDPARYKAVLKACSLEADLKILEYHDETEVGEKGTSLSGGQKARVALARALYSPAKYVLIDDALSAVDAHTAEHLYKHYLLGPLMKGRTCLLVTHSVTLCLPGSAYAVALDNGRVTAAGPADLLAAQGVFDHETGTRRTSSDERAAGSPSPTKEKPEPEAVIEEIDEETRANEEAEIQRKQDRKKASKIEETYGKGAVGLKQYKLYLNSFFRSRWATLLFWISAFSLFALSRITDVGVAAWLRKWAASYAGHTSSVPSATTASLPVQVLPAPLHSATAAIRDIYLSSGATRQYQQSFHAVGSALGINATMTPLVQPLVQDRTVYYLSVYAAYAFLFIFLSLCRDGAMLYGALRASRILYDRMTNALLRAKPQFFDRTPVGRIMNRFSKDLETVDVEISPSFMFLCDSLLEGFVILSVSTYALPVFAVFAVIVVSVYGAVGSLYIVSSRDLKRIESVQRSPVFTLVGEALGGAVAIRAYGDSARFTRHCLRLVDKASRPFLFLWYENRWLSIRADTFAGSVSFFIAVALILKQDVDAALAGFTLSFTIQMIYAALWTVRMIAQNEINFNSVERISEYLDIEPERSEGTEPPAAWPTSSGTISVEGLTVRYSPEFEPVLKDVSFEVQPGEKVGIVGRTGSGKSTLALSMFRFLEAEAGSIVIDGIHIAGVPLKTLRQRLTVIPQDAQLFSGTVRSNLDPFGALEDAELWQALVRVKLAASGTTPAPSRAPTRPASPVHDDDAVPAPEAASLFQSLDAVIEQGGRNLSAGQRQLLALARGLLKMRESRILILDESTANLDSASDQQIQRTIRQEMAPGATILVIAHRLRTIIDFDKILVLDKGRVLEYASPYELLQKEDSSFRELCERSGEFGMLFEAAEKASKKESQS